MKFRFLLVAGLAAMSMDAAERNRGLAVGRDLYIDAEFRQAAARLRLPCMIDNDAEACYWAGLSYERLSDVGFPFGCKTAAKAHDYLSKALALAPDWPVYRQAFFDFLLTTGCSRKALSEALAVLSTTPESDPDYRDMRRRLQETKRVNASVEERLGRLFLAVPRATYRVAAAPGAVLTNGSAPGGRETAACGEAFHADGATAICGGN